NTTKRTVATGCESLMGARSVTGRRKALALTGIRPVLKSRLRPSRGVFERSRGPRARLRQGAGPPPPRPRPGRRRRRSFGTVPVSELNRSPAFGSSMLGIAKKIFGSSNDRKVKDFMSRVQKINALEAKFAALSDDELRMMTDAFRDRLAAGESLDKMMNEAFAVAREASKRVLGQRQYDVQLTGGMILHDGGIAEMRTGEGKTLVAVAPVYLNALAGKGVHVITVNDYLARRDAEWIDRKSTRLNSSHVKI